MITRKDLCLSFPLRLNSHPYLAQGMTGEASYIMKKSCISFVKKRTILLPVGIHAHPLSGHPPSFPWPCLTPEKSLCLPWTVTHTLKCSVHSVLFPNVNSQQPRLEIEWGGKWRCWMWSAHRVYDKGAIWRNAVCETLSGSSCKAGKMRKPVFLLECSSLVFLDYLFYNQEKRWPDRVKK